MASSSTTRMVDVLVDIVGLSKVGFTIASIEIAGLLHE
jgi:hypothetical protein